MRLCVLVMLLFVAVAGCGELETESVPGIKGKQGAEPTGLVPSSLVGTWRHKIDREAWPNFALDGRRIDEMVFTFDADGSFMEVIRFTDGGDELRSSGTLIVEKEKGEARMDQVSLPDDVGLFGGTEIKLVDDEFVATIKAAGMEFTFSRH